jgi:hypothetical protein
MRDETPWLREMLDEDNEDLLALFSEDEAVLKTTVPHLISRSVEDADMEERLVELLETAVAEQNDDTSASVMTAIILGEIGSARAIGALIRCLALEADEALQDAAQVALLRLGPAAIVRLMETIEEDETPTLNRAAYDLLGRISVLEDTGLNQVVKDFLEMRVELERHKPTQETGLEQLFRASAYLGDRRQIEIMKTVLAEDHRGYQPAIQDALELLEENTDGVPFIASIPPWEEHYGWLFEDQRDEARVTRSASGQTTSTQENGLEDSDAG